MGRPTLVRSMARTPRRHAARHRRRIAALGVVVLLAGATAVAWYSARGTDRDMAGAAVATSGSVGPGANALAA